MPRPRRPFTREFNVQAVKLVTEQGDSSAEAARQLGVRGNPIRNWKKLLDAELSGATPSEAMTWGKVDPDKLPGTVTCYVDSTLSLPLIAAYAMTRVQPRPLKRYIDKLPELTRKLHDRYAEVRKERGE